jgi:hypothetical protein
MRTAHAGTWRTVTEAWALARTSVTRSVQQREARQIAAGQRADDARRRGLLTVQELWLRFVALGGNADQLELDGFLAGVLPLPFDQQAVLGQALRERRMELPRPAHEVPAEH